MEEFGMKDGFIRVAAATPEIQVADCGFNRKKIQEMMRALASNRLSKLTVCDNLLADILAFLAMAA